MALGFGQTNTSNVGFGQVWGGQDPYLQSMYGLAQGQYNQAQGVPLQQAQQFIGGVQGAAGGAFNALAAGPQNPYLTGMVQAGMDQVGRQFQQQIMPGLIGGANAAGQLGGERYGLLQGQAVGDATRAMGDVANQMYGQAWTSGMQGQQAALQALPQMQNLGMASLSVPWANLGQYANMLGNPTILNTTQGKGGGYTFSG